MAMSDPLATFDSEVAVALTMANQNDQGLVKKIGELDALMASAPGTTQSIMQRQARTALLVALVQHPTLLQAMNFDASLVSVPPGQFWATVVEACAEHAANLPPEQLLPLIESLRRREIYDRMQVYADLLDQKLGANQSEPACKFRSKLLYELHMAHWQQGSRAASDAAPALLQASMDFATRSADEAEKGGDPAGALFARMNISGLILPALGRIEDAMNMSTQTYRDAMELAARSDTEAAKRPLRVAMNCLFHRMDMAVKHGGETADVSRWLGELEANSIYQSAKDQGWARTAVEAARAYIASK
jgi:hypothetical protein